MWNDTCKNIFLCCIEKFQKNNIRYFILRNFELLPDDNLSKDIDIVVDPVKIKQAMGLLKQAYQEHDMKYYDSSLYDRLNCTHAIPLDLSFGIHIDLLAGFVVKGYEIYSFDEMYQHTVEYNGLIVLDQLYDGIMLFISKMFGYKVFEFKQKYIDKLCGIYAQNSEEFESEMIKLFSRDEGMKYIKYIKNCNFEDIRKNKSAIDKSLKRYARKKAPFKTIVRQIRFVFLRFARIVIQYKKNLRAVVLVSDCENKREAYRIKLAEIFDRIYVDSKCQFIEYCVADCEQNSKYKLLLKLMRGVHYDKVLIIESKQPNGFGKMIPNDMIIDIEKVNEEEAVKGLCGKYMEKLN